MAYNVKYRLEYTSRGGYTTKGDILSEGYSGPIIELTGSSNPLELVYESSSDNQFAIWKNSYVSLNLKETSLLKSDFLEIENEDKYILKYYRNDNLMWSGYILQEQYSENDDPNNPFISIKFYDALSRLRIYTINDTTLSNSSLTYSLTQIFTQVNNLLYTNIGGNGFYLNDFLTNTINSSSNLFDVIYIQRKSFFDKDNNPYNLFDVLERIARSFNLTYLLYKNEFTVTNFEFSKNPKFVDFGNSKSIVSINNHTGLSSNIFWINKSKGIYHWDSLKKMEVYHKYEDQPNYISSTLFDNIIKLREYVSSPSPIITSEEIQFQTFANLPFTRGGSDPSRSYKDVSVNNTSKVKVYNPSNEKIRFQFKLRMELDYGITESEFNSLNITQRIQLENDIKQIESATEISVYYQLRNDVSGTTYYYNTGRTGGNYNWDSGFQWNLELNSSRGLQVIGIDKLIEGYDYALDIITKTTGLNELTFKFYQPYVYTNLTNIPSTNTRRIQGVKLYISNLSFTKVSKIGLEEIRYEGVTDRNVFNYNLNRDFEYYYSNFEEGEYKYSFKNSSNSIIDQDSFNRKNRNYVGLKSDGYNIEDLLLNQNLEQFGFQQQYITGDLMVRNNLNFDIFSTLTINGKDFSIQKFNLDDKTGVYNINLIELK